MTRALAALLLAPILLAAPALARDVPGARYPLRDDVGLLDGATSDAVRRVCVQLERETAAELAVLIIDTTAGEDPHDFALRVFNTWRIGKADRDNGVLLMFVTRDRRVEILPGYGYEGLFTRSVSERLLTGVVVPRMRSGQPREAVLEGARAVADKVSELEGARARIPRDLRDGYVEIDTFGGGRPEGSGPCPVDAATLLASDVTSPSPVSPSTTTTPPTSRSAGLGLSPGTRARFGRDLVRAVVFLGLIAWAGFLFYVLSRTFSSGELAVSKGGIIALSLLVPLGAAAALLYSAPQYQPQNLDWGLGGGGLLGGLVACTMTSHICPRCRKWMSIDSRTLVSPTYHSSGTGERIYDCASCSYHKVETYTISRRTRSSSHRSSSRSLFGGSSSSRSSFGGSSSFGGGSSRGGGGGASW